MVRRRAFRDPTSGSTGRATEGASCQGPSGTLLSTTGPEDRVAGVARFAVAWSTPDCSDGVMRQAMIMEFAPDEGGGELLRPSHTQRAVRSRSVAA
jgi:hypothetical protein